MLDCAFVDQFGGSEENVTDDNTFHRRDQRQPGDEGGRATQSVDRARHLSVGTECCGNNRSDDVAVVVGFCPDVVRRGWIESHAPSLADANKGLPSLAARGYGAAGGGDPPAEGLPGQGKERSHPTAPAERL